MRDRKAESRRYYQKHKEERRLYQAAYRAANKQRIRTRDREYNRIHRAKLLAYGRRYKETHRQELKIANRFYHLRKKYNLTKLDYQLLVESQGGRCAICGKMSLLYVDHNHVTDEVRGLLCNNCNVAIGNFEDNPELLQKAIHYLVTR